MNTEVDIYIPLLTIPPATPLAAIAEKPPVAKAARFPPPVGPATRKTPLAAPQDPTEAEIPSLYVNEIDC